MILGILPMKFQFMYGIERSKAMAYSNFFPAGYQPVPQFQTPQPQQQPQTNIVWVQGEAGAKSYLVAPNTTVQLWDSEKQVIYLKSADASGMPSMKVLDYTIREQAQIHPSPVNASNADYITREEFNELKRKIESLTAEVNENEHTSTILTD